MSDTNSNANEPTQTIIKQEEMPDVNTLSSASSHDLPVINKQETEASDALSSFNNILLDQEAHDVLLGLTQLTNHDDESNQDESKESATRTTSTSTTSISNGKNLTYCSVCRRSSEQVNFHKNYTINTNNYKNYCGTFPHFADQIPKPKEGESHVVCSTCYNKQWRFANGKYDPHKDRAFNKREGLQRTPKAPKGSKQKAAASTSSENSDLLNTSTNTTDSNTEGNKRKIDEEEGGENLFVPIESPNKRVKRASKAKKGQSPTQQYESKFVIESTTPPVVVASTSSNNAVPIRCSFGIASASPAASFAKKEEITFLISYMKRFNGILEDIYTTKIATHHCPETVEQLRDLVMERLSQKKGDVFIFDRACCNSVDRFNNPIKIEIDEFFFKDVKLANNDSLWIYVNDKQ
ncbi:predicted protein [Naegleria gruberi]|uniref:Predicted protein n=1 Tax=Naegleria gruberi TaxID=5762 RepID=D2W419_NAEGR|nr:uncharacterized protein NAEGRDRAFT_76149 [Naegleria gruberi]EFC36168.1 predicted protein [Naegleria gruberi]|eukprot:XP_002668912.1 predicted protein [Naegleria gruberi strain NEG-M]